MTAKRKKKPRIYNSKQQWCEIGGRNIYFRSAWEIRFGRHLQALKETNAIADWLHEPETFWFLQIKRGVRSYKPDFKVIRNDGTHYWVEVKGFLDSKSNTKIKRFIRYYPNEQLLVCDAEWFNKNLNKYEEQKCGLNGTTENF